MAAYSRLYDGELANADHHLADLLEILDRTEHLERETIVIVTSDHGEHIGEYGLADHHASLSEYLTGVPFILWGPGIVKPGRRADVNELADLFPSICRLLDEPVPTPYLGRRRNDLFLEEPAPSDEERVGLSEWRSWNDGERGRLARRNPSFDFSDLGRNLVSARDGRFKLVRTQGKHDSLFDLTEDPGETQDVARKWPEEVARLAREIHTATTSWSKWEQEEEPLSAEDSDELEKRLSALGYI